MKKASVLIVDDRVENLITLENLLESPDLEVVRATSGQEALAKTLDHAFALVLMDVQMPGMDGYETAELLRGHRRTCHLPIIFVTAAWKEREHIFRGYDSGAVDYLFKPLEPAVLRSKVGVFLSLYRQRIQLEEKTRELDAKLVELEELHQALETSHEKLRLLSSLDGLTGLPNRRHFDETLKREWHRGIRNRKPLSIILVDIDYFKAFNDAYGHIAGDDCLRRVAEALAASLFRETDVVARYGGEEFTAILPDTDAKGAEIVGCRMREVISSLGICHVASPGGDHVTISLGISTLVPTGLKSPTSLVAAADKALYSAKEEGRNCCCMAAVVE